MIENQWYAIASSKDVKKGRMLGLKRMGLNLVLFRNQSGLHCLMDLCSHRGAALSKGKLEGECVQCPFHGLEFDGNGACCLIPANGRQSREDYTRYNVQAFPVREVQDIIFFWYGDAEPDKEVNYFPAIDDSFAMSELADHWPIHYSRSIENQLDVVHLPFVHNTTIGRGHKTVVNGPKVVWLDENTFRTSADNEVDEGQKPLKNQEAEIKSTNLNFKFPNIWLNNISDKLKIMGFFAPIDDENTMVYLRFYNKFTPLGFLNKFIAWTGKWANYIVERQDKRVVITQRPKASRLRNSTEHLLRGDKPIIEYRKRRAELKAENRAKDEAETKPVQGSAG